MALDCSLGVPSLSGGTLSWGFEGDELTAPPASRRSVSGDCRLMLQGVFSVITLSPLELFCPLLDNTVNRLFDVENVGVCSFQVAVLRPCVIRVIGQLGSMQIRTQCTYMIFFSAPETLNLQA